MDVDTFKTYGVNILAFYINLADFNAITKSITLVLALGYTAFKALNEYKKWKSKGTDHDE